MKRKSLLFIIALFSICLTFNVFAITDEPKTYTPENEVKHMDKSLDFKWTWLNDEMCVRFMVDKNWKVSAIQKRADMGLLSLWTEPDETGSWRRKTRNTYSGKWSQADDGTWSFEFDDKTIPVGVARIDDVLYAFNGCGDLQEGYEYYDSLTTGADGVVDSDDPEFLAWLETRYLPDYTSHN